ncbi:hypothetical protein TeGR_g4224 [Tetraparma gracilis]|uniref:Uncharacterized protein n=1 Tax=Tetraparma gracilis TaxID=2962635 RepID=A0ABQ6M4M0_9STRA|nr:hypothetical protein TeGR_g4224 [Tetraparma gracilis]
MSAMQSKRGKIVAEILSTENSYVSDLTCLIECFVVPIKTWLSELVMAQLAAVGSDDPPAQPKNYAALLSQAQNEHNAIFSNIEQLLAFNRVFEKDLTTSFSKNEGNNIGKMFCDAAPFFKMLLTELLKCTTAEHPDYTHLQKALELVSSVAVSLNDDMKSIETRKRTMDVATQFESLELLTPSRLFVKQGVLTKVCRQSAQRDFTFVLFNDCIIYGSPRIGKIGHAPNGEKYHKLHREISLHNSFVVDNIPNFMEGFLIINSEKSFYVNCGSAVAKNEWVSAIRAAHADLDSKLQRTSSWRSKHSKWENEIEVWGFEEDAESKTHIETWGLNGSAMNQGRGVLGIIPPESIKAIGEPGAALLSSGADEAPGGVRASLSLSSSGLSGGMSDALRRMSHKFSRKSISSPGDREGADARGSDASFPPPPPPPSTPAQEPEFQVRFDAFPAAPATPVVPNTPFNNILYSGGAYSGGAPAGRPKAASMQGTRVALPPSRTEPPPKPARRSSAPVAEKAALANIFVSDAQVKYTGAFPLKIGPYGLGLELVDATSPYPDGASPSIVRVSAFSSLPNGKVSPGLAAGVKAGDYLVAIEGVGVATTGHVLQLLQLLGAGNGSTVEVRVRRGGVAGAGPSAGGSTPPRVSRGAAAGGSGGGESVDLLGLNSGASPGASPASPGSTIAAAGAAAAARRAGGSAQRAQPPASPARPTGRFSLNHEASSHHLMGSRAGSEAWSGAEGGAEGAAGGAGGGGAHDGIDVMEFGETDFMNLLGVTKHRYRSMSEADRSKLRKGVGLS